jgi:hypothetical protein
MVPFTTLPENKFVRVVYTSDDCGVVIDAENASRLPISGHYTITYLGSLTVSTIYRKQLLLCDLKIVFL